MLDKCLAALLLLIMLLIIAQPSFWIFVLVWESVTLRPIESNTCLSLVGLVGFQGNYTLAFQPDIQEGGTVGIALSSTEI